MPMDSPSRAARSRYLRRGRQGRARLLQIGAVAEKIKDAVYVRYLPRSAVYALPKKTEDILNARPNDLRDRHLVRLDTE